MKAKTALAASALLSLTALPVLRAQGTGRPSPAWPAGDVAHDGTTDPSLVRVDLDADGLDDLLLLHPTGRLAAFRARFGGAFEALRSPALDALPPLASAVAHDRDADGAADLLVVTRDGGVRVLDGDGAGGFHDATRELGLADAPRALAARWADLDGDTRAELVLATADGFAIARHVNGAFQLDPLAVEPSPEAPLVAALPSPEERRPDAPAPDAGAGATSSPAGPGETTGRGRRLATPRDTGNDSEGAATGGVRGRAGGSYAELTDLTCASSIRSTGSGGECIEASTMAEIGKLYPMSQTLNVNSNLDRVGIGTTLPAAKLDVRTEATAIRAESQITSAGRFVTGAYDRGAVVADTPQDSGIAGRFNGVVDVGYRLGSPTFADITRVRLASWLNRGSIEARNSNGEPTVYVTSEEVTDNGAQVSLTTYDGLETITLDAEYGTDGTLGSRISLFALTGNETVEISSQEATGNGAQIALGKADGTSTIVLDAETARGCEVSLRNSLGVETIEMVTEEAAGNGAQIILKKADGSVGITLDAEQGGDGRVITEVLEITGGADLVEGFDTGSTECPPGSVVVIDETRPGVLTLSSEPYDFRVAGVVSGAGGVRPGLSMGQAGVLDGATPVALTGRVYVRCSTEGGPIAPGHLLTTSSTRGVAMRAVDASRANGAVIGKAMGALADGSGLVLVLVNLQ